MACDSSTCQSGCYRDDDSAAEDGQRRRENGGGSNCGSGGYGLCIKCKVNEAMATTDPAVAGGSGDGGRFCADCFRSNLFGKFRFAVTSNAMISPSDNVLVAFSGGSSSRVALQFVHEMQHKAQKNFDASRDRLLPVFGVGVAYIDERAIYPVASNDFDRSVNEMELITASLAPPKKQFFIVPIENLYSTDSAVGRQKLTELLDAVDDVTGKEDLVHYLQMQSLQKVAFENGYTKIMLGTCTYRIACHVLEATVKGQGFSLAADIQYVDARSRVPVVLPLRDCLSEELKMLCSLERLRTTEAFQQPRTGINGLIASFVRVLKDDNPSRESTIVRTAGKLTPFSFNRIPEDGDHSNQLASKRRQKKYNLKPNESLPPDSYCLICNSPLKKSPDTNSTISEHTCPSCQYQILPKDLRTLENFISLLPASLTAQVDNSYVNQKLLRDQIRDFLLSDSDDGT
ncbi:cytoplasmic tRNA 2-thiolation protein 2 [Andrographis paniculata]|uniref:cytoplasmic tRNA 2-thiolation protein 2 n=1 Tax=Andrographis paniculata TaxID=175694 RepID=UPI0021E9ABFA|nr:cytoplasmic tRNA 2-thiolation protein 2 [Andrographis paniculata]